MAAALLHRVDLVGEQLEQSRPRMPTFCTRM
jgi:hypothetical protein